MGFGFHVNKVLKSFGFKVIRVAPYKVRKLNIGAGAWRKAGWHNLDFDTNYYSYAPHHIDLNVDLTKKEPLQIPSASVKTIFTSHTFEHLKDDVVQWVLEESYRLLGPGGIIRINCPDAQVYVRAFQRGDSNFFLGLGNSDHLKHDINKLFLKEIAHVLTEGDLSAATLQACEEIRQGKDVRRNLDVICKQVAYNPETPGHHVEWYDPEKMVGMLRKAGFKTAYASKPGESRDREMRDTRYFDARHPQICLFVEAVR